MGESKLGPKADRKRVTLRDVAEEAGVSLKTALPLRENTAYAGIRAHYFTLSGTENPITCTVERVIPNPFSVVYMLKTPGGALLRMESEKAEALHTGDTITLHIAPEDVMPLTE